MQEEQNEHHEPKNGLLIENKKYTLRLNDLSSVLRKLFLDFDKVPTLQNIVFIKNGKNISVSVDELWKLLETYDDANQLLE